MALPPDGRYPARVDGVDVTLTIQDGHARLAGAAVPQGRVEIALAR